MKKGDSSKCKIFYILAIGFCLAGITVVAVSLGVKFLAYDAFAYVGAIIILFGICFAFLWYALTIPYDPESLDDAKKTRKRRAVEPDEYHTSERPGPCNRKKESSSRRANAEEDTTLQRRELPGSGFSSGSLHSIRGNSVAPSLESIEMELKESARTATPEGYVNPAFREEQTTTSPVVYDDPVVVDVETSGPTRSTNVSV